MVIDNILSNKIKKEYQKGKVTYNQLAEKYGVHKNTICRIVTNNRKDKKDKLSNSDVEKIRKEYKEKYITQIELAKKYGVHRNTISLIINNKFRNYLLF